MDQSVTKRSLLQSTALGQVRPLQSRSMRLSERPPLHADSMSVAKPGMVLRLLSGVSLLGAGLWLSGTALDHAWCLSLQQALSEWHTTWSLLTWSALGICALLLVTCLSDGEPRRVAALLVAMVLGGLVVHALKRSLQVDRPLAFFGPDHPVFQVIGEHLRKGSMPSGHTTTAFTVAGLMTLSLRLGVAWVAWWALAALQGLSRVVVGAHWPSDVLAGAGLGLCLAPLVWQMGVTQRFSLWLAQPSVRPWVAGGLPVLAVLLCLLDLGSPLPLPWCVAVVALGLLGAWRWGHAPQSARASSHHLS